MKKMLMVATVPSMIGQFNMENIRILKECGYEVHVACNFLDRSVWTEQRVEKFIQELDEKDIRYHQIDFPRSPLKIKQVISSYKQLKSLTKTERAQLVHCHTPIAGAISRLVAHKLKIKVIYTAHGFHFFKGAPIKNWLIYYPIEKVCSYWTDVLITINKEDYALAKRKLKAKQVKYVPGIGVDTKKINKIAIDRAAKRRELGVPEEATILLSVGELNKNKNHETVIRAIAAMDVYYLIAGKGELQEYLQKIIEELGVSDRVKLLGFRNDVLELYKAVDIFVFPSFREGLSVALMEAMASGLPVACSKIRGNVDLIDEKGGVLFESNNISSCKNSIKELIKLDFVKMSIYNTEKIKKYEISIVNSVMNKLYEERQCD